MAKKEKYEDEVVISRVLLNRAYEEYRKVGSTAAIDPHKRYDRKDRDDAVGRIIREYYAMGTAFYGK